MRNVACRAPWLTMCVFVRRHRDILEGLRPPVLFRLAPGHRAGGTGPPAASPPAAMHAVAAVIVAVRRPVVVVLLSRLGDVVGVRVGVSRGAVEGVVAAVIPRLPEHVVGDLQALVPRAGRFQERQRLPPALRHLSLSYDARLPLSLFTSLGRFILLTHNFLSC